MRSSPRHQYQTKKNKGIEDRWQPQKGYLVRVGPEQTPNGSKLGVSSRQWYEGLEERANLQFCKKWKTESGSQSKGVRGNALVCRDEEIAVAVSQRGSLLFETCLIIKMEKRCMSI